MSSDEDDAHPLLRALGAPLRCQICKDYMKGPMITSCGHTFCSLCIRRCLAHEQACPACRAPDSESKLRKNNALEDCIDTFWKARSDILKLSRPFVDKDPEKEAVAAQPDSNVCPVCGKGVKLDLINEHLDSCLAREARKGQQGEVSSDVLEPRRASAAAKATTAAPSRIPKMNYALMTETRLRTLLKEAGIPSHGSKLQLQRRHTEWANVWNANMDVKKPVSKRELLRRLDEWERSVSAERIEILGDRKQATTQQDKEWSKKYDDQFQSLIENARKSRSAKRKADEAE